MNNSVTVGFIGNPNCGKTTLFNAYTGANLNVISNTSAKSKACAAELDSKCTVLVII